MDPSIAKVQEEKEHEIVKKYKHVDQEQDVKEKELQREQSAAARILQRTYRGHRARRELRGLSLDPTTRWVEVVALSSDTARIPLHQAIMSNFHPIRQSKKPNTSSSPPPVADPRHAPQTPSTTAPWTHAKTGPV